MTSKTFRHNYDVCELECPNSAISMGPDIYVIAADFFVRNPSDEKTLAGTKQVRQPDLSTIGILSYGLPEGPPSVWLRGFDVGYVQSKQTRQNAVPTSCARP